MFNVSVLAKSSLLALVKTALVGALFSKVVSASEQALHSVALPDFAAIADIKQKKSAFFNFLKPAVEVENAKVLELRKQLVSIADKLEHKQELLASEQALINSLTSKYKVKAELPVAEQLNDLLIKVDIVPKAIILVQAANESAWGTSRFARVGLNFFGIWCYRQGCGMVPSGRNNGAKHEVAAFQSVEAAVSRYLYNINSHWAYEGLRAKRAEIRQQGKPLSAEALVVGLMSYSQRGQAYVDEISAMLRYNKKYLH